MIADPFISNDQQYIPFAAAVARLREAEKSQH